MRENRLAVLLVSHDLNQVFRLADRVYVLNHGRIVGMERPTESTHHGRGGERWRCTLTWSSKGGKQRGSLAPRAAAPLLQGRRSACRAVQCIETTGRTLKGD
jgi:ABC-type microcin C transport system duplicated ATPase subunit YejF